MKRAYGYSSICFAWKEIQMNIIIKFWFEEGNKIKYQLYNTLGLV